MAHTSTTIIDLTRLSLSHGEGRRLDIPVRLDPLELGGQTYVANPESPHRPPRGLATQRRLRVPAPLPPPSRRPLHALPGPGSRRSRGRRPRGGPAQHRRRGAAQPLRSQRRAGHRPLGPRRRGPGHPHPIPMPPRLRRPMPSLRRVPERLRTRTNTTRPPTPAGTSSANSRSRSNALPRVARGGAENGAAAPPAGPLPVTGPRPELLLLDLCRLFVAPGEPVAAALHGGEELLKVHFERVEDLVGVVLGAEADLPLARAGVLDDLVGGTLGLLGDLLVGDQARPAARAPRGRSARPRAWPRPASPGAP